MKTDITELVDMYDRGYFSKGDFFTKLFRLVFGGDIDAQLAVLGDAWRTEFLDWARKGYDNLRPADEYFMIGAPEDDDFPRQLAAYRRWWARQDGGLKHTAHGVRRTLIAMRNAAASPVQMLRYLRERGYVGARPGVALKEAFGPLPMRYRRIANSWREDGSGAEDDVVNREVMEGIREAEAKRGGRTSVETSENLVDHLPGLEPVAEALRQHRDGEPIAAVCARCGGHLRVDEVAATGALIVRCPEEHILFRAKRSPRK